MLCKLKNNSGFAHLSQLKYLLWLLTLAASMHFYVFKWDNAIVIFILLVANFLLIVTKGRLVISLVALSAFLIHVASNFPRIDNHANLELLYLLNIFIGFYIFRKGKAVALQDFIRLSTIVFAFCIYFFAGFHKLNHDFLNPLVSCVNFINSTLGNIFNASEQTIINISKLSQWLTLLTELVLPFGLFYYRTRLVAAFGIALFHIYISFAGLANFGSFGIVLLLFSVIPIEKLNAESKNIRKYASIGFIAILTLYTLQKFNIYISYRLFAQGLIFNIGILLLMQLMFKNQARLNKVSIKHWSVVIFIFILLTFWSMKSYIGLGNTGNLTMFSNIITDSNKSNHLFINTRYTKLTHLEEDQVYVLKIDSILKRQNATLRIDGMYIPKTELAYRIASAKGNQTGTNGGIFIENKDTVIVNDLMQSKFADCKWWYRFISFRAIQPNGPNRCRW